MVKYRFEQIAINSTEKKKPVEEDRFTYLGLLHLDSGSHICSRLCRQRRSGHKIRTCRI